MGKRIQYLNPEGFDLHDSHTFPSEIGMTCGGCGHEFKEGEPVAQRQESVAVFEEGRVVGLTQPVTTASCVPCYREWVDL